MKLYEFLIPLNFDTLIIINNVDRPRHDRRQQYQKLRNIKWEKIRNVLEYDVMSFTVNKDNGGLFVQVFKRDKVVKSLEQWGLVDKYFQRKDHREGKE